jgi:hypothetical protein
LGTQEIEKLAVMGVQLGNAAGKTFADGKVGPSDFRYLFSAAEALGAVITINFRTALAEARDLSAAEITKIVSVVERELDIPSDKVKAAISEIIEIGFEQYKLINRMIGVAKGLAA